MRTGVALAVAAVLVLAGCIASPESATDGESWTVTVVEVVDGDTLAVQFADGHTEDVRLLGVDAPETHAENRPAEFEGVPGTPEGRNWLREWGHRADEFARSRLAGERVTVRTDPRADRRGGYGRLLVYVEHDGGSFNRALLERGYARLYDGPFARRDAFARLEARARREGVGLWGDLRPGGDPAANDSRTLLRAIHGRTTVAG